MPDRVPVLFDTDIGSDIDDAIALWYLLRQPRCELVGVTTVTGEVAKRAALVQMLCELSGSHDVPIHAGARDVLLHGPGQPDVPHYDAVKTRSHRLDWPANTAIDFMRQVIRERPGEITLVSVGPLTNVALLFAIDPDVAPMLKAWVSMGGIFTDAREMPPDWNCICDPVATAIAFRAAVPAHVHVGLDVTLQCRRSGADVRTMFTGPAGTLLLEMADVWFKERPVIVFHDPLAAVVAFQPAICRFERGTVTVDPMSGRSSFERNPIGHNLVALQVDLEAFFRECENPSRDGDSARGWEQAIL